MYHLCIVAFGFFFLSCRLINVCKRQRHNVNLMCLGLWISWAHISCLLNTVAKECVYLERATAYKFIQVSQAPNRIFWFIFFFRLFFFISRVNEVAVLAVWMHVWMNASNWKIILNLILIKLIEWIQPTNYSILILGNVENEIFLMVFNLNCLFIPFRMAQLPTNITKLYILLHRKFYDLRK